MKNILPFVLCVGVSSGSVAFAAPGYWQPAVPFDTLPSTLSCPQAQPTGVEVGKSFNVQTNDCRRTWHWIPGVPADDPVSPTIRVTWTYAGGPVQANAPVGTTADAKTEFQSVIRKEGVTNIQPPRFFVAANGDGAKELAIATTTRTHQWYYGVLPGDTIEVRETVYITNTANRSSTTASANAPAATNTINTFTVTVP